MQEDDRTGLRPKTGLPFGQFVQATEARIVELLDRAEQRLKATSKLRKPSARVLT